MSNATGVFNMSSDDVVESNDLHIDMTTPKGEYIYADRNITKIIVETVTMSIMWTFSLIINILVCVVIYIAAEDCESTTNYFVVSLAAGDICFTVFCVPFIVSRILTGTWLVGLAIVVKCSRFYCYFNLEMITKISCRVVQFIQCFDVASPRVQKRMLCKQNITLLKCNLTVL